MLDELGGATIVVCPLSSRVIIIAFSAFSAVYGSSPSLVITTTSPESLTSIALFSEKEITAKFLLSGALAFTVNVFKFLSYTLGNAYVLILPSP